MKTSTFLAALLLVTASASPAGQDPVVYLRTELGVIVVTLDQDKAPVTSANFLRYVEAKRRRHGLPQDRDDGQPARRRGEDRGHPGRAAPPGKMLRSDSPRKDLRDGFKAPGRDTVHGQERPGFGHLDFFICLGAQPEPDFGGRRNKDGQGFAAFGRVVRGWTR